MAGAPGRRPLPITERNGMHPLSPRELLEIFYPDPVPAGQFAFYTTTLEKGNEHSHWCHYAPQADRLVHGFRNTRRVRFGAALQSEDRALQIARQRRRRAQPGSIRGCAASVTALPALWAAIPYGAAAGLPTGRRQALGLVRAVRQPPSIVISTRDAAPRGQPNDSAGGFVYAFWLRRRLRSSRPGARAGRPTSARRPRLPPAHPQEPARRRSCPGRICCVCAPPARPVSEHSATPSPPGGEGTRA